MRDTASIQQITRTIVEAMHPNRVVLFGSRARGTERADSDVDLMIEMESDLPPRQRENQIDELFADRNWSLDVVVYTPSEAAERRRYRYSLVSAIEREGKVLYVRP